MRVREARARYFEENGFGDGGYDARWVKLQAGPVPIFLPNTAARVAAVRRHDVHHVLTGYATTWTGEAEIAAWELASGCGRFWAAWVLNLQALLIGMFIAPGAILRALARGRVTENLYRGDFDDRVLDREVESLKGELRLDRAAPEPGAGDVARLAGWCAAAAPVLAASFAVALAPIALVVWLVAG